MRRLLVALALGVILSTVRADDWPQWRGPDRTGISKETGLLKEWPREGPKLVWQITDLGEGYGAPAVVGERIYFQASNGKSDEYVVALNAQDGKKLWTMRLGAVGPNQGPQYVSSRSTPTVEGELLYALGSDGELACLETASGKVRWQKQLRKDFGGKPGAWAYAESPLIDGDVLVCTPGGDKATMVALKKTTGDVIWQCPVPGGDAAGYASVIVVETAGRKQYVQFLGKGLVGVDAKSGKFLWRYDQTGKGPANIPTPVAKDGYIYTAASRFGGGLVKLKVTEDGVAAEQVYYERGLPNNIGGSVLIDGHLYGTTNEGLQCVEFTTGKVKWKEKSVGASSILAADGKLYLHGENDQVILADVNPSEYKESGRFSLPAQPKRTVRGEVAWAYPALANGRFYVRDVGVVWCYDVKGK